MRDFGRSDWQLAGMVCMTLWNYSEKISSSVETFGEQETADLLDLLVDLLGKLTKQKMELSHEQKTSEVLDKNIYSYLLLFTVFCNYFLERQQPFILDWKLTKKYSKPFLHCGTCTQMMANYHDSLIDLLE